MTATAESALQSPFQRRAERLTVIGFRCCMAGYDYADADCWEAAWDHCLAELGADQACPVMGQLQYWVRSIRRMSQRALRYYPQNCQHLCHDECMALAALACAQHRDRCTGMIALQHLIPDREDDQFGDVWRATEGFAATLAAFGLPLAAVPKPVVEQIAGMGCAARRGCPLRN